jgi:hypothetical protein
MSSAKGTGPTTIPINPVASEMNEYLLIFRRDYNTKNLQLSDVEMKAHLMYWQQWLDYLKYENILAWPVQQLDPEGLVIRSDEQVNGGPYLEANESVGGMIIISAASYESASEIAKGCPVLELGGSVEIRKGN